MGYRHIENLYKNITILAFKECFALEKVHGTPAHVKWSDGRPPWIARPPRPPWATMPVEGPCAQITYFSGGESHERFMSLFDANALREKFTALGHPDVVVYGEAYGGKQQGMKATYGDKLCFIAFEVQIGETWLAVPNAEDVCNKLGIEFVPYARGPATVEWLNEQRDADSIVAVRRGMGTGKKREGVVARPITEFVDNRGDRVIVKHKRAEFMETRTPREVDPEKLKVLEEAEAIAQEWVTPMRLEHVLQKIPQPHDAEKTGRVIKAMIEDVEREAEGEIVKSPAARKAISALTSKLYKNIWSKIGGEA